MISALSKLPDGTVELTITIPAKRTEEAYQKTLSKLAENVAIKGFRKGKAPLEKAEKKLGEQAVYERTLRDLVTDVYLEAIKEQGIKPVINPQIKVTSFEKGKDWQIVATTCELPEVELKDYKSVLQKELAAEKIWVPGKDKAKTTPQKESQRLDKIFKTLLATCQVTIPKIMTEEEVNRRLTNLVDQIQKLGLTVEQYLASKGKTQQQLRADLEKEAQETFKLELILAAIADQEKVEVGENEVEKMIQALPGDEKSKKSFDSPTQRAFLRQLLRKRVVIDNLTKL